MAREHGNPDAGARDEEIGQTQDLAALVPPLLLLVGLAAAVVDDAAGEGDDVERDRRGEFHRSRKLDGVAVLGEPSGAVGDLANLLVQLGSPGEARPGHGLVARDDDPAQAGHLVEGLQDGHRHHRRAVRVGDDSFRYGAERLRVDLGHDQWNVRVHSPRGRVVDDDGAGSGNSGGELEGRLAAAREQREVDAGEVGAESVLDRDGPAGPRQRAACRSRAGEIAHALGRELTLLQNRPHHRAHLSRGAEDSDSHAPKSTGTSFGA